MPRAEVAQCRPPTCRTVVWVGVGVSWAVIVLLVSSDDVATPPRRPPTGSMQRLVVRRRSLVAQWRCPEVWVPESSVLEPWFIMAIITPIMAMQPTA